MAMSYVTIGATVPVTTQAQLERTLKELRASLATVNAQIAACLKTGGKCDTLYATKATLTKKITAVVAQLKALASVPVVVKTAPTTVAPAIVRSPTPAPRAGSPVTSPAAPTAPTAVAVESTKAGVNDSGQVVVSPDAVAADVEVRPTDVVVSTGTVMGSVGTIAVVGIVGFIGYRIAKKKGWL